MLEVFCIIQQKFKIQMPAHNSQAVETTMEKINQERPLLNQLLVSRPEWKDRIMELMYYFDEMKAQYTPAQDEIVFK
jgi:hypothetical protein